MRNVNIDNIGSEISSILKIYPMEIQSSIEDIIKEEAKQLKRLIQQTAPVNTGAYKKSWAIDNRKTTNKVSAVVYSKNRYQIVHLIEHGRYAGHIGARPHIAEAESEILQSIERRITDVIGG